MYMTAAAHDMGGEVPVSSARERLPELLDTAVHDGGVVYLTRYGRRVGAIVPAELAERIEELEDAYWSQRAAAALKDDEPAMAWDDAVARLETGDVDA